MINNPNSLVDLLVSMGYQRPIVSLAIKEAKNQSLDEIIDLISENEEKYKNLIGQQEKEPYIIPLLNNKSEKKQNTVINKNSEDEVRLTIQRIAKDLSESHLKDPNQFIIKLDGHLDTMKNKVPGCLTYISKHEIPMVLKLKNAIFTTLARVLTMKANVKLNRKKFDETCKSVCSLNLIGSKQQQALSAEYQKYCKKNQEMGSFDLMLNAAEKAESIDSNQANSLINTYQPNKGLAVLSNSIGKHFFEEKKVNEDLKIAGEIKKADSVPEVYCIICMKNARGVVLMPCKHFLTCVPCSPKILNCPVCTKKVQDHMTIFWS